MPKLMKPPTDGYDNTDTGSYDGPPPKPALYKGKVVYLGIGKIKNGDNKGKERLSLIVQITEGKFKGASVRTGLNFGEKGDAWINQFLRSLTDGSEAQWNGIRNAFWKIGYMVGDEKNGLAPIEKIGKKTNPVGMTCAFVTKMRTREDTGEEVADIARFVTPMMGGDDDDDDDQDALDDMGNDESGSDADDSSDDTSSDDTEDDSSDDDSGDDDSGSDSDDDGEDPWS